MDATNVVYKAQCGGPNCDVVYVGETKRTVRVRASEHLAAISAGQCAYSALAEHCISMNHTCSLDAFVICDREGHWRKRRAKESLFIAANPTACNNQVETTKISPAWLSLCKFI